MSVPSVGSLRRRRAGRLAVLASLAVALWIMGLAIGPVKVNSSEIWIGLFQRDGTEAGVIVREIRFPATTSAALAGMGLALAGLIMQTYFRNPIAGPDVLGVSAGASLGVACAMLASGPSAGFLGSLGPVWTQIGLAGSAAFGAFLVLLLALWAVRSHNDNVTLLVLGLMLAALASSAVAILVQFARPEQLQNYIRWLQGSFDGSSRSLPVFGGMTLLAVSVSLVLAKPLNALQLGTEHARNLGVPVAGVRLALLTLASVLSGLVTAYCGPIAFLGIAAPHLARRLFRTSEHRWLIPASLCWGVTLACGVHVLSKGLTGDYSLPVNALFGLVGAPIVIAAVLHRPSG